MKAETVAAIGALVHEQPDLLQLLEEHLEDNDGQVLPHLVMADVIRWLVAHRATHAAVCRDVLNWLEQAFANGSEDVRGMIVVSGVELIPDPGKPGSELRELLGPNLRSTDPWLP